MRRLRWLALLSALAGLALAGGCAGWPSAGLPEGRGAPAPSGTAAPDRKYRIVYVQGVTGNPFFTSLTCGAQAEAESLGTVDFTYQGGQNYTPEAQTRVLNAVIARRPDAIIISPMAGQAMVPPLTQAKQAGITLVFADTTAADASLAASFVASDNTEGGRFAANYLARLLNGQGKVLIESCAAGISTCDERLKGFGEEMKNYPGIEPIATQYSQADPSKATSHVSAVLSAHPDLAGVFAVSTQEVEGAAIALTQAGKQGAIKLVGFDTSPPILEHLRNGVVHGLVVQEPAKMGSIAMQQAVAALSGRPTIPVITTHFVLLTRDNMNDPGVAKFIYKTTCP